MWFVFNKYQFLFIIVLTTTYDLAICDAISNSNFNSHIRDYSAVADINNITNVKTLQKEDLGKYATFTPASNPIKFKEIPDSALSSSSNGRGLLYHDQPGYEVNDYDGSAHYSHGHDYHLYENQPDVHSPPTFEHDEHHSYPHSDYHDFHDFHGHRDYLPSHGHHYYGHKHHHSEHGAFNKHYKHALAAKTVLWPIAGIALLGAAAALVSNPVLLQLGVISGKRRRRNTEEITGPDFLSDTFAKYEDKIKEQSDESNNDQLKGNLRKKTKQNKILKIASLTETTKRKLLKTDLKNDSSNVGVRKESARKEEGRKGGGGKKIRYSVKRNIDQVTTSPPKHNSNTDDDKFIPIPIILRHQIKTE